MPGQITAFDIGECMVKAACLTGGKLKKVMAKELPDNMVSGGEIVSMDAMADFIKEMAKENGISRGAAAVILPGTLVFTRNVTVPAMTDGQLLYNLPFEFKDYLTQEKNKYYFDYAVQDTVKDEEGNVKELQLFVCATLKSTVEEYRAMLRRAGFNLKVAMPEECAYAALTEDYMQRTNAPAGSDYCFVDLGHNGIRMHILQDGDFTTKRSVDLGLGNGAKKPVKYPTKRTVNLAKRESHSQSVMTLSIGTAVIIVLVVLVVKFGVLDQLARQSAAESAYNTVHAQYTEMQSAVEKYPEVEEEYRTYSRKWMQQEDSGAFVSVDRQEVLDLMENCLQPYGTIKAVTISDDVMIVSMSGMNLQEISAMFEILQQQPIVKSADLTIASTEKTAGEDLDFSVTITLQPADTAEGEATA